MSKLNMSLKQILEDQKIHKPEDFKETDQGIKDILDQKNALEMSNYLNCPHKNGYWKLDANWIRDGALNNYVFNDLKKNMPLAWKKERKEDLLDSFTKYYTLKISVLLSIFAIASQKKDERESFLNESNYQSVLRYVDWDKFEEKYSDSLKLFNNEFNYSKFK